MKRIFIALKIEAGENLLTMISAFRARLNKEHIKWTDTANMHLTLAFLGNIEENTINAIMSMLDERCEGFGKFELVLKGSGYFRNITDPRIIWVGIETSEKLVQLYSRIMNGLKDLRMKVEDHPFNPHLTIGRIKQLNDKKSFLDVTEEFKDYEVQLVPVNEVILFESILLPAGPVYKPLKKVKL